MDEYQKWKKEYDRLNDALTDVRKGHKELSDLSATLVDDLPDGGHKAERINAVLQAMDNFRKAAENLTGRLGKLTGVDGGGEA